MDLIRGDFAPLYLVGWGSLVLTNVQRMEALAPYQSPLVLGLRFACPQVSVLLNLSSLADLHLPSLPFRRSAHPTHSSQLELHRPQSAQNGPHALTLTSFPAFRY